MPAYIKALARHIVKGRRMRPGRRPGLGGSAVDFASERGMSCMSYISCITDMSAMSIMRKWSRIRRVRADVVV